MPAPVIALVLEDEIELFDMVNVVPAPIERAEAVALAKLEFIIVLAPVPAVVTPAIPVTLNKEFETFITPVPVVAKGSKTLELIILTIPAAFVVEAKVAP